MHMIPVIRTRMKFALAAVAFAVFSAACSDSTGPEPVTGTYTLRTVNGMPLPFLVAGGTSNGITSKIEVAGGNAVLRADKSFTSVITVRETNGSTVTDNPLTSVGTYTVTGSTITFVPIGDPPTTATLADGTITGMTLGLTLVFSK